MSLNDYEILKQIGTGAFSTVSLVKSKKDNLIYALKRVELTKMMPNEKDNSLNEIRLLASVNHKNVISYKESFYEEETNTLNLVLEYADAGDLQTKITQHKNAQKYFSEKTIWSIFIQMVQGIKALHDKNIIHRDLKSANIFLMKNGVCKLGDLNVSKEAKTGLLKTQTGTPYFASPEVWSGKPYGVKSDIWSLGCILYQMATLKMPFQGNNFKEVYNNVLKCKYSPLPKMYSKDLDFIIKKLLQIEPDKRPSAKEILDEPIIKGKIKLLFNSSGKRVNTLENENTSLIRNINQEFKTKVDLNINSKTHIKLNNLTSRLLKTAKYKERNMKDILSSNKGYKINNNNNNNYRIFQNYDTNPSVNEEKKLEIDNKINNDKLINKKYYNKSSIKKFKKYKTINYYFIKAKSNLQENLEKRDMINKNCTLNSNYTLNNKFKLTKQNTSPYINHISEGNSINTNKNNDIKEIKKENNNQIKIPLLNSKNKLEKFKNTIPRNCISAKTKRKALSENRPNKYYNSINNQKISIQSPNNYQYKKILPLNSNLNNNEANSSNSNNNINQKKRLTGVGGYGYEFSQTDIDNKETTNTTAGKSIINGKNVENKLYFNLSSKQKEKHIHSLSKINKNKDFKEDKESYDYFYNKKNIKSIPKGKNNKNISTLRLEGNPVKPNLKISNLFKEFNEMNSKEDISKQNKEENSFQYTINKKDVKRNKSTFEFNNEDRKKVMTLHQISTKKNYSQNGLDIDLNTLNKNNKYTVFGAKLSLPNKKFHQHKKLFKKSINNIKILENINNENPEHKYNNTSSNRGNLYYSKNYKSNKNDFSLTKKDNDNMHKSISLATMEKKNIYNTQSNKTHYCIKKKIYQNDLNKEDSNSFNKKLTSFKFDDFKVKRLKKNNYNTNERKKMAIKFHHIPFIKTLNKEKEKLNEKEKEEQNSNEIKNKNVDPTIKMLINPIKIVEKKSFKRKLFPVHTHIKLNKLNLLNNISNKDTNQDIEKTAPNEI